MARIRREQPCAEMDLRTLRRQSARCGYADWQAPRARGSGYQGTRPSRRGYRQIARRGRGGLARRNTINPGTLRQVWPPSSRRLEPGSRRIGRPAPKGKEEIDPLLSPPRRSGRRENRLWGFGKTVGQFHISTEKTMNHQGHEVSRRLFISRFSFV